MESSTGFRGMNFRTVPGAMFSCSSFSHNYILSYY